MNPDKDDLQLKLDFDNIQKNIHMMEDLKLITSINFDIFHLRSISSGNELVISINYLMEINDFYAKLKIDPAKFRKYSIIIQ